MIYSLTCNPSLDYMVHVNDFLIGKTNRSTTEKMVAGGKGINVSIMLRNLGLPSVCLGFVAGFTGEEIRRQVKELCLDEDFVTLEDGANRVNVKLSTASAKDAGTITETEINGIGPAINEISINKLMEKIHKLQRGDILILSGSVPKSLPETFYMNIMEQLGDKKVRVLVDAAGALLKNTFGCHPFLIKPNKQELEEFFQVSIQNEEELLHYARKMQFAGAKNVLVSLGSEGAVFLSEDGNVYRGKAPKGQLINGVGAGDAMVAGFLAGYLKNKNYEDAFKRAIASGSATAFSKGFASEKEVEAVRNTIEIKKCL